MGRIVNRVTGGKVPNGVHGARRLQGHTLRGRTTFRVGCGLFAHCCHEMPPSPPHDHDFWEIGYVVRGTGRHRIRGVVTSIFAGDVFVIVPGSPHGYEDVANLEVGYVNFTQAVFRRQLAAVRTVPGFREMFGRIAYRVQRLHMEQTDAMAVESLFKQMWVEWESRRPGYIALMEVWLTELIIRIARACRAAGWTLRNDPNAFRPEPVRKVLAHIEENYRRCVTLGDMGRHACLHPQYLCRVFKRTTGLSPIQYLKQVRMDHAIRLLRSGDKTVAEVCFEVGFNDPTYFIRTFRRCAGMTPGKFQHMAQRIVKHPSGRVPARRPAIGNRK